MENKHVYGLIVFMVVITGSVVYSIYHDITVNAPVRKETMKKNCDVLIVSEHIISNGDPNYWRTDSFYQDRFHAPYYHCDRFYDIETIMLEDPKLQHSHSEPHD